MGIMGMKIEKKEKSEKKTENPGLKAVLKELNHVVEAIEFAEGRGDEKLRASYESEAVKLLRLIKTTYGAQLSKLI